MTCQHNHITTWQLEDGTPAGLWSCAYCRLKFEPITKSATGKAFEDGRRAMLDEVLKIAPDSISVLLEKLKEGK